ncbi:MAG TPA: hypothetical protein VMJ10_12435 [Kofleriaceae bacterium]|nr:hypothetical protein [Kofleriaceae bacterium]
MARESGLALLALACLPGCSLILNFSDSEIPKDAPIDGPFTAAECSYDTPNGTFDTAAMITPGVDTGPAAVCAPPDGQTEDDHYYKFAVPGTAASVTVSIMFVNAIGDLDLKLFDSTATMIAGSFGFGDGETIVCPATSPSCPLLAAGTYVFEVLPATPDQENNYTFSVTVQ